jgi:hypothetical protein
MRRLALLWLLASCASVPEPLAEPPLLLIARATQPNWLAGLLPPVTEAHSPHDGPALQLRVLALAVRETPLGHSVQDMASMITATGGTPFPGASATLGACRMLTGPDAASWLQRAAHRPDFEVQELGRTTAIVAPEIAARITADRQPFPFTLASNGRAIHVVLQGGEGDLLAVATEIVQAGDTAILWMPAGSDPQVRFAFGIENLGEATAQALLAAQTEANAAPAVTAPPNPNDTIERQLALAKAAIGERNRRPALLALTRRLQLPDLEDVLLCADGAALLTIANGLPEAGALPPGPEASWSFARDAWHAVATILQRDSASPALRACLLRHLGAVCYDPTTLELLLQSQPGPEPFQAALREENLTALGDRSTASRVRAKEWLAAHGIVVPGYDPLADIALRRQALRAYSATTAAQAAAQGAAEARR